MNRNEIVEAYAQKSHVEARVISYILKYYSEAKFWIYHQVSNNYKKYHCAPMTRRVGRKKPVVEAVVNTIIFKRPAEEEIIIERMYKDIAKIVKKTHKLKLDFKMPRNCR